MDIYSYLATYVFYIVNKTNPVRKLNHIDHV